MHRYDNIGCCCCHRRILLDELDGLTRRHEERGDRGRDQVWCCSCSRVMVCSHRNVCPCSPKHIHTWSTGGGAAAAVPSCAMCDRVLKSLSVIRTHHSNETTTYAIKCAFSHSCHIRSQCVTAVRRLQCKLTETSRTAEHTTAARTSIAAATCSCTCG